MTTTTPEELVTESQGWAIAKCSTKGCKSVHRIDYVVRHTMRAYLGRPSETHALVTENGTAPYRDSHDLKALLSRRLTRCACGGYWSISFGTGRKNDAIKCGGRCRSARRASCECECAGANHGAGH